LRIVLGVLLVIAACATSASAQIGRVNGVIRNDNGQPIKGATVTAESENTGGTLTATTDDKGRFTMIGLRSGLWRFIAQAPGHRSNGTRMGVRVANVNPPILISLDRTGPGIGGALERVNAKELQSNLASAEAQFNSGRWDDAITAYRAILAMAPPLRFVQLQIAAAYIGKKDYPAAQAAYRELLKTHPGHVQATLGLAALQQDLGDLKAAEETLTRAATADGGNREVFNALGDLVAGDGRDGEAVNWFEKASAADPYWGKPLYKLGVSAMNKGDRTAATEYWQRTVAVDPQSPEADLARTALGQLDK
jgi:Flp pilus assembly protein TadD